MPFYAIDDKGEALEKRPVVSLLYVGPNLWQLQTPFCYLDGGSWFDIPSHDTTRKADLRLGNATDLASVPWILWDLFASFGRQSLPALLHDHRCFKAHQMPDQRDALAERRAADHQFYRSLKEEGFDVFHARVMWTAVSVDAYKSHAPLKLLWIMLRMVLTLTLVACGLAVLYCGYSPKWGSYAVNDKTGWFLVLAALIPVIAGPERLLILLAALLLPLFLPIIVLKFVFVGVIYGLGLVVSVVAVAASIIGAVFGRGGSPIQFPHVEPFLSKLLKMIRRR